MLHETFKGNTCFRYGELVNINMVRDKATGKTKGFCFICYEDQRSTDLAVDNFNGIKVTFLLQVESFFAHFGSGNI